MKIRQETKQDELEIYQVVKTAFETAQESDGNEHELVVALRKGQAFIPELSLVAEIDNQIVGHIMFTKAKVGHSLELALAPLSVLPDYQRQGIGTALIKEGHRIAKQLGYQYSIVLGSEKYYPRIGYLPAEQFGIHAPFDVPSENFMAICLQEEVNPVKGTIEYAKEFGIENE